MKKDAVQEDLTQQEDVVDDQENTEDVERVSGQEEGATDDAGREGKVERDNGPDGAGTDGRDPDNMAGSREKEEEFTVTLDDEEEHLSEGMRSLRQAHRKALKKNKELKNNITKVTIKKFLIYNFIGL